MTPDASAGGPGGWYLALETSGPVGSVALAREGTVHARAFLAEAGQQSSQVLPALAAVLDAAALRPRDLAGVVVGAGPGSFTGVRIAAATAKGLVHALGLPLWAFSSLAAAALGEWALAGVELPAAWRRAQAGSPPMAAEAGAAAPPALRYVLFDARGERVYAACFRTADGAGVPQPVVAPHPATLSGLLEEGIPAGAAFVGDGALRHAERIRSAGHPVLALPAGFPTADALLHLHAAGAGAPLADPARWEPEYLKTSSAEQGRAGL